MPERCKFSRRSRPSFRPPLVEKERICYNTLVSFLSSPCLPRRFEALSNINDQENNVFTRTTQQAIKPPADTTRVRQAEDASSFRAAPVERHRRSDRYRSAGDASSFRPAVQPAEDNRFQDGGAAAPQWARRMPEDTDPALERYTARPRVPADDYDEPEEKRRPLVGRIVLAAIVVLVLAAGAFYLLGPYSPLKNRSVAAGKQQTAEALEFKAVSTTGVTGAPLQLQLSTSPVVTAVQLVDDDGVEIPCTFECVNPEDESHRLWTIRVVLNQPFEGNVYARIRDNGENWTTTEKSLYLTVAVPPAATDAPSVQAAFVLTTEAPTDAPTDIPTETPTDVPTDVPTDIPTDAPTDTPTDAPTVIPTQAPIIANAVMTSVPTEVPTEIPTEAPTAAPTEVPTETPVPTDTPVPTEAPTATPEPLTASAADGAAPDDLKLTETLYQGAKSLSSFSREKSYIARFPDNYAFNNKTGVYTFRGDNFRRNAAFGTVEVADGQMDVLWSYDLGSLRTADSGTLYGVGWNNQPAIVKWTKEVREMMNVNEESKNSVLCEVIFSAQDGKVYFLDLKTGAATRDPIDIGYPMRGSVSVDPQGRPMISFGQAISKLSKKTGAIGYYLYNLIDQTQLAFINGRSSDKQKQYSQNGAFDGCSLFVFGNGADAMLVAGENGLLYTVDLNAEFTYPTSASPDTKASLTVSPDIYYLRAKTGSEKEARTSVESAISMYRNYVFLADGYGIIRCVDTDTMRTVWAVDAGDNTDAAPALDDADGTIALYTGNTAFSRLGSKKDVTIRRLNAMTGEEAWQYTVKCAYDKTEQSGCKASPLVGQNDLNGLVYFTVNQVEGGGSRLIALDKQSGQEKWRYDMKAESISSPVAVYNEAGNGWVVQCDSAGNVTLLDGLTGYVCSTTNLGGTIEASPAVYRDKLVVGTCSKDNARMYCLQIH